MRAMIAGMALALATACPLPQARAEAAPPGRYLYLTHWAQRYLSLLQGRGRLPLLNWSVRPYHRGEVARALQELDTRAGDLLPVEREWVRLLMEEVAGDTIRSSGPSTGMRLYFRPEVSQKGILVGDALNGDPAFSGEVAASLGRLTGATRVVWDPSLLDDPTFVGDRDFTGRVEEGYVSATVGPVELFGGRVGRTWGPLDDESLVLSAVPYSYDHLFFQVRSRRILFSHLIAQLDDMPLDSVAADTSGTPIAHRFLSAHRLDLRLGQSVQVGFTETILYGGPDRNFELVFANPFTVFHLGQINLEGSGNTGNTMFGLDLLWSRPGRWQAAAQLLVDDAKVPILSGHNVEVEPNEFGWMVALDLIDPFRVRPSRLRLRYARVANFTYNAMQPWDRYLFQGRSLGGALGNDVESWSARWELSPRATWVVTPFVQGVRRGEGRIVAPFGPFASRDLPFPSGVIERTLSIGIGAFYQRGRTLSFSGSLGVERIRNEGNVRGEHESRARGEFRISLAYDRWLTESDLP